MRGSSYLDPPYNRSAMRQPLLSLPLNKVQWARPLSHRLTYQAAIVDFSCGIVRRAGLPNIPMVVVLMSQLRPLMIRLLMTGMAVTAALPGVCRSAPVDPRQVRDLMVRLYRSDRLLLEPQEVARRQADRAALLQRTGQGKTVSPEELQQLLRTADEQEKAAVDHLARQFRVQVYKTFRRQRGVFTRRRAAWTRAETLWEAAGGKFEDQDRLIDWLELALRRSMPNTIGPLPEDPVFEVRPDPPEMPSPESLAAQPPTARIGPAEPTVDIEEPVPLPATRSRPEPTSAPAFRATEPTDPWHDLARPGMPLQPDAAETAPPRLSPVEPTPLPPRRETDRVGEAAAAPPLAAVRRPAEPPPIAQHDPLPATEPVDPPARDMGSDAALPFPIMEDPFAQPVATEIPNPEQVAAVSPPLPDADPPATENVRVNIDELATRIANANRALGDLSSQVEKDRGLGARQLGPLVDQLDELMTRIDDLTLFRRLISPENQAKVGQIDAPRRVISLLGARIFEARTRARGSGFSGQQEQRLAELRHLDALSEALAQLAIKQD